MLDVILVADFGSSNVRVHAINAEDGDIVASHAMKYPLLSPKDGFAEHDPDEMWRHSVHCMENVMAAIAGSTRVRALSFSHIGSSLVPMDEHFNATYNCILGMDSRAGREAKVLEERLAPPAAPVHTSFTCTDISTMAKAMYIQDRIPSVAKKTAYYLSIQQFILKKLGLPPMWDATIAGAHCCYDLVTREWSAPVLRAAGLDPATLGAVVNSHDVVGEITSYGTVALGVSVPVVIGGHDAVMGTIGLGVCDEADDVIAEVTGSVDVFCLLMNRIFTFSDEGADLREGALLMCEPGPLANTTICLSGYKTAGAVIEWFIREVYGNTSSDPFADLWSKTVFDGAGRTQVDPNFVNAGGKLCGIDITTTKFDLFKACIEAISYESRGLLENCIRAKQGPCNRVRIGGGHASADKWVQFRADLTGKTYERMANGEVSALGTAVLAAYGTGLYPSVAEAIRRMVRVKDRFTPNPDVFKLYNPKYKEYIGG